MCGPLFDSDKASGPSLGSEELVRMIDFPAGLGVSVHGTMVGDVDNQGGYWSRTQYSTIGRCQTCSGQKREGVWCIKVRVVSHDAVKKRC